MQIVLYHILLPPTRAAVAPVTTSAAVTPATDSGLLDNNLRTLVDGESQNSCPEEEDNFNDPQCKAGLQHRASLVNVEGQRVIGPVAVVSEGTQRNVNRATIPMRATGPCNKSQLVDTRNESTEEQEIDESDKHGGALGGRKADQGIEAPESCNDADDEEDENVGGGNLVRIEVAIDEVCLDRCC